MLKGLKSHIGHSVHAVRRILGRPITVRIGRVELGAPPAPRARSRDEERLRVRRMKRDLFLLLDRHPTARQLMRHLDLLERTFRRDGLKALDTLPVRVLGEALEQLEKLVWDWSPIGLAELRSRIAVAVKTRQGEREHEHDSTGALELALETRYGTYVSEVEHAEFEEMERSWAGQAAVGAPTLRSAGASGDAFTHL